MDLRRALLLLVVAQLVVMPSAAAAPSSGVFAIEGILSVVGQVEAGGGLRAGFIGDTSELRAFILNSPFVDVCVYEQTFARADTGVAFETLIESTEACYQRTDVEVQLDAGANHEGWMVIEGNPEATQMRFVSESISGEARESSILASPEADTATVNAPEGAHYRREIDEDHSLVEANGALTTSGRGWLKIKGPDFISHSRENVTREPTYDETRAGVGISERHIRWIELSWREGTLRVDSDSPTQLVVPALVSWEWSGEAVFVPVRGTLETESNARYENTGGPARIRGQFSGEFIPLGARVAHLSVAGELESTTLGRVASPGETPPSVVPIFLVGLSGLMVGGAAGAVILRRTTRAAGPMRQAMQAAAVASHAYQQEAEIAEEEGRIGDSLALIRAARRRAPADAYLALCEATYLWELGQSEESLAAYQEASHLAAPGDGEPDYWAAVRSLERGNVEEAEVFLLRALSRDPTLAEEVYASGTLSALSGRARCIEALTNARARLTAQDEGVGS